MWKKILQRKYPVNISKYENLKQLLNAIRSLPNSNADSERIFFMLTDVKTKKRNSLSANAINAICVVKSALKARGGAALNMNINAQHLQYMTTNHLYKNLAQKETNSCKINSFNEIFDEASSSTQ